MSLTDANVVLFSYAWTCYDLEIYQDVRRHLIFRLVRVTQFVVIPGIDIFKYLGPSVMFGRYHIFIGREKHSQKQIASHFDCQWFIFSAHPEINTHIMRRRIKTCSSKHWTWSGKIQWHLFRQNNTAHVTPKKYISDVTLVIKWLGLF